MPKLVISWWRTNILKSVLNGKLRLFAASEYRADLSQFKHNTLPSWISSTATQQQSASAKPAVLCSNRLITATYSTTVGNLTKQNHVNNYDIKTQHQGFTFTSLPEKLIRIQTSLNLTNTKRSFSTTSTSLLKMAKIISGKEVSDEIRAKLKGKIAQMRVQPKLAIVQVGGREDSNVYIRMKILFAESIGACAELIKLSRDVSEDEVAETVQRLNQDTTIHGIITQLPFDASNKINSDKIVNLIDPKKDVDGLSVYNAGKLLHGELLGDSFVPCTPNGCMELIKKSGIKVEGTRSVVIGRSKIVGSPMAQLLNWHNSTVTLCHSRTKDLEDICRQADILVAAVGSPNMVKKSWLKPGAVVIDCGINAIPDATKKSGQRLVGDVDFDECKEIASAITPVPGGVGPMTVAMLIANTVESAARSST